MGLKGGRFVETVVVPEKFCQLPDWARSCVEVVRGSKKFYNFKVNFNKEIFERAQKIKNPPQELTKCISPTLQKELKLWQN